MTGGAKFRRTAAKNKRLEREMKKQTMKPIVIGGVANPAHVSVVLDVLRNKFFFPFTCTDGGVIHLVTESKPHEEMLRQMYGVCDGAVAACIALEDKIRLHGGKL